MTRATPLAVAAGCLLSAFACLGASAQDPVPPRDGLAPQTASSSARAGMFLPLTMGASTTSQRGFTRAFGGYDSARRSARAESTTDATLIGPLAARVTIEYGERVGALRPGGGLRLQTLHQDRHGVDMTVGAFYRAEGFTEAEGEFEGVFAFARHLDHWGLFANLVYGQDPEGNERDGEVRLATLYELGRMQLGVDSRTRFNLGHQGAKQNSKGEASMDTQTGAMVTYAIGPVAFLAHAGFSGMQNHGNFRAGAVALAGLAGSI